jgi:hypothetical protein
MNYIHCRKFLDSYVSSTSMHRIDPKKSYLALCCQHTFRPICALAEMVRKGFYFVRQVDTVVFSSSIDFISRHKNMGQLPPGVKWIWPTWCRISHM